MRITIESILNHADPATLQAGAILGATAGVLILAAVVIWQELDR